MSRIILHVSIHIRADFVAPEYPATIMGRVALYESITANIQHELLNSC